MSEEKTTPPPTWPTDLELERMTARLECSKRLTKGEETDLIKAAQDRNRLERAAEKIIEYARHHPWCYAVSAFAAGLKCDCGLVDAKAALEGRS